MPNEPLTAEELAAVHASLGMTTVDIDREKAAKLLCAMHGHPPVVEFCFGYVTCARCGAQLGDALLGSYPMDERAVVGHDCNDCRTIVAALTPDQRLLTKVLGEPAEASA